MSLIQLTEGQCQICFFGVVAENACIRIVLFVKLFPKITPEREIVLVERLDGEEGLQLVNVKVALEQGVVDFEGNWNEHAVRVEPRLLVALPDLDEGLEETLHKNLVVYERKFGLQEQLDDELSKLTTHEGGPVLETAVKGSYLRVKDKVSCDSYCGSLFA